MLQSSSPRSGRDGTLTRSCIVPAANSRASPTRLAPRTERAGPSWGPRRGLFPLLILRARPSRRHAKVGPLPAAARVGAAEVRGPECGRWQNGRGDPSGGTTGESSRRSGRCREWMPRQDTRRPDFPRFLKDTEAAGRGGDSIRDVDHQPPAPLSSLRCPQGISVQRNWTPYPNWTVLWL